MIKFKQWTAKFVVYQGIQCMKMYFSMYKLFSLTGLIFEKIYAC